MTESYRKLLKDVGQYGYGVFSNTMLSSLKEREGLKKFVYRNPSFFSSFEGRKGDLTVRKLSPDGFKHFQIRGKLTKSQSWQSHLDILMFNSYMHECNVWVECSNKPHSTIELNGKKVGIISLRWGINSNISELDLLLCTPQIKESILSSSDPEVIKFKEKIYVPNSIRSLRPTLS